MELIEIQPIPSQSFSLIIDKNQFDISIYPLDNNNMAIDIILNGSPEITGLKIVPNTLLNPYAKTQNGNFVMSTLDNELINYKKFGIEQHLYYIPEAELNV